MNRILTGRLLHGDALFSLIREVELKREFRLRRGGAGCAGCMRRRLRAVARTRGGWRKSRDVVPREHTETFDFRHFVSKSWRRFAFPTDSSQALVSEIASCLSGRLQLSSRLHSFLRALQ